VNYTPGKPDGFSELVRRLLREAKEKQERERG
jgi:hypothetical protein